MSDALLADYGRLANLIKKWLAIAVPQQFVALTIFDVVKDMCQELRLPAPVIVAGNIVIGDLSSAQILFSAHLDEASFSVTGVSENRVRLAACHRYVRSAGEQVSFLGVRESTPIVLGNSTICEESGELVAYSDADIRLGDRAVYHCPVVIGNKIATGKAADDRLGALIALHTLAQLLPQGLPVAVVLSDGEQNFPEGYFSRTFPHVLHTLSQNCLIVFVDGIFLADAQDFPTAEAPTGALIVPHSGAGRGYSVPPRLFAHLRDELVPRACALAIDAKICSLYHSRGDDWGMVTNPTSGCDHQAFFVSFGGWGLSAAKRHFDINSIGHCERFLSFATRELVTSPRI